MKKLYFLFLLCAIQMSAQNLIQNGDFEDHKLDEQPWLLNQEPVYRLGFTKHWDASGIGGANYIYQTSEFKPYPFAYGDGVARMEYVEGCPYEPFQTGCFTYLHTQFTESLQIGEVYKLSFQFYSKPNSVVQKSIYDSFGVFLSRAKITVDSHDLLLEENFIPFEFKLGEWNTIELYIRPLCELNYLTIGVSKNAKFPTHNRPIHNPVFNFVDDFSLTKIEETDAPIIPTAYCEYYEREERKNESILDTMTLFFDQNSAQISTEDSAKIATFYNRYIEFSRPIILEGYSSTLGSDKDNLSLSENRIQSVSNIIQKMPDFNKSSVIHMAFGEKQTSSNSIDYKQNQKVKVYFSSYELSQHFYDKILHETDYENYDRALNMLSYYIQKFPSSQLIVLLFDNRFNELKKHPSWKNIHRTIIQTYPGYDSFFLDSMYCETEKFLKLDFYIKSLGTQWMKKEEVYNDHSLGWHEIEILYQINLEPVLQFVNTNGLPTFSEHGRRPANTAYRVILMLNRIDMVEKHYKALKSLCEQGEADWKNYAIWTDMLDMRNGRPQTFGTTYDSSVTSPQEFFGNRLDEINKRRIKIGLHILE